jgi:hypothetical protein
MIYGLTNIAGFKYLYAGSMTDKFMNPNQIWNLGTSMNGDIDIDPHQNIIYVSSNNRIEAIQLPQLMPHPLVDGLMYTPSSLILDKWPAP